jgi:hypothetical protein
MPCITLGHTVDCIDKTVLYPVPETYLEVMAYGTLMIQVDSCHALLIALKLF